MYILQTYFYWHEIEERGFSREFETAEKAIEFTRNNACGSRWEITDQYGVSVWSEVKQYPTDNGRNINLRSS